MATARDITESNESGINRAAKSDRIAGARIPVGQRQTISIRPDKVSGTSFLLRVPAEPQEEARNRTPIPGLTRQPANARRPAVACEPVVSVLTEVAKQLQPGRCVT